MSDDTPTKARKPRHRYSVNERGTIFREGKIWGFLTTCDRDPKWTTIVVRALNNQED
jgi:hypothetical protein